MLEFYKQNPQLAVYKIRDAKLHNYQKQNWLISAILKAKVMVMALIAIQRGGKDCAVAWALTELKKIQDFRAVCLFNFKRPPFVAKDDMYYSISDIPAGTKKEPVYVWCSELEMVLNARNFQQKTNVRFTMKSALFAQNNIKFFGTCKLASNVDINFFRVVNFLGLKYVNPINIEHERVNVVSPELDFMRNKDPEDKAVLTVQNDRNIFNIRHPVPSWYDNEFSNQFHDPNPEQLWQMATSMVADGNNLQATLMTIRELSPHVFEPEQLKELGRVAASAKM